jgi:hypothetical protein
MSYVTNAAISRFITDVVNLDSVREKKFRAQVTHLRKRFATYAADHPNLQLKKLLGSGSIKKRTHNANLNDIDIAAYMDLGRLSAKGVQSVNRVKLLNDVCDTLRQVYGETKAYEDFEVGSTAVKIHFHGSGLDVDVVPVVVDHASTVDEGWVMREGAAPLRTCIPRHAEFIQTVHANHPGYREFVRLLKWWRTHNAIEVRSFLLELLAAHLCRDNVIVPNEPLDAFDNFVDWVAQTGLDVDLWFADWFRDPGGNRDRPFVMDPVNPDNNAAEKMQQIWGSSSQRLQDLVDAADEAAGLVTEAKASRTKAQAREAMGALFGPSAKAVIQ